MDEKSLMLILNRGKCLKRIDPEGDIHSEELLLFHAISQDAHTLHVFQTIPVHMSRWAQP